MDTDLEKHEAAIKGAKKCEVFGCVHAGLFLLFEFFTSPRRSGLLLILFFPSVCGCGCFVDFVIYDVTLESSSFEVAI